MRLPGFKAEISGRADAFRGGDALPAQAAKTSVVWSAGKDFFQMNGSVTERTTVIFLAAHRSTSYVL
jgi:hypothetical protein